MKKSSVWATLATLLTVGSALASPVSTLNADRLFVESNASFPGQAPGSGPFTTNNDDTCDIAVTPAATLLLPNFEVDFRSPANTAVNTIFTITNVSNAPQIAHITIWTDRSFPVIDFNVFLTGYDVQGLSLYDIISRGIIAPPNGTSSTTRPGPRSLPNNTTGNPNFSADPSTGAAATCVGLPGQIPADLLAQVQTALTTGAYFNLTGVGNTHTNAIGYVTVDVANTCSTTLPTTATYFTTEILYDNVLIGDYQRINPSVATGNYAGGNPLVHIRAVPEGGPAGLPTGGATVNFPYTFYDRYTDGATVALDKADRRQPLPGRFAARYIQGGPGGFNTEYAIWREGTTGGAATQAGTVAANRAITLIENVRFDESENVSTLVGGVCTISPCPANPVVSLPETSRTASTNAVFPPNIAGTTDGGGWMYMNLNNGSNSTAYSAPRQLGGTHAGVSQNWVTVQLTAESRFGVDFDAAYLGNGCSPNPGVTTAGLPIGPSPNVTP